MCIQKKKVAVPKFSNLKKGWRFDSHSFPSEFNFGWVFSRGHWGHLPEKIIEIPEDSDGWMISVGWLWSHHGWEHQAYLGFCDCLMPGKSDKKHILPTDWWNMVMSYHGRKFFKRTHTNKNKSKLTKGLYKPPWSLDKISINQFSQGDKSDVLKSVKRKSSYGSKKDPYQVRGAPDPADETGILRKRLGELEVCRWKVGPTTTFGCQFFLGVENPVLLFF